MSNNFYCDSRPVPEKVKSKWIPTALYKHALELYEANFPDSKHYLDPTACHTHVKNLQLLAKAPTLNFTKDHMMPGFVGENEYESGFYKIGRVEIKQKTDVWMNVALVVNDGDADVYSGHWGGAFLIGKEEASGVLTLTPLAWIRSFGVTVTYVEQAKNLPKDVLEGFDADSFAKLTFDQSKLIDNKDDKYEAEGLFGRNLKPGLCKTGLEKLVGVAYCQMMRCNDEATFVQVPESEISEDESESDEDGNSGSKKRSTEAEEEVTKKRARTE